MGLRAPVVKRMLMIVHPIPVCMEVHAMTRSRPFIVSVRQEEPDCIATSKMPAPQTPVMPRPFAKPASLMGPTPAAVPKVIQAWTATRM